MGVVITHENCIAKLYVDPAMVRQGIGRRLYQEAERSMAGDGHDEVVLWAVFDEAIPFYEAMGMCQAGRKFDVFERTAGRNAMLMKKFLAVE